MQILYVGSDFCSSKTLTSVLPKYLLESGERVDVVVPRYDGINEGESPLALRLIEASCHVDNHEEAIRVYEGRRDTHIRVFYMESDSIRKAPAFRGDEEILSAYVFAHAVCQFVERISTHYDVILCDGLATAFVPVLMRTSYIHSERISAVKVVQCVQGIEDKGAIDMRFIDRLGLSSSLASSDAMEFYGRLSLLKGVYLFADKIVFPNDDVEKLISSSKGRDIGMEGVLFSRADSIAHVRIGIDRTGLRDFDISTKAGCKAAFCKKYKLNGDAKRPLVAFIGRIDSASGIDLVNDSLDDLMDRKVNLVICGDGPAQYVEAVRSWTDEFLGSVCYIDRRSGDAREILSAADICLFAPKHESLDSLILKARHFGCIPVARNIGAVKSAIHSVRDLKKLDPADNGISFDNYDSDEFFDAVMDALDLYTACEAFKQLQTQAVQDVPCLCSTAKQVIDILNQL